MSGPTVLQRLRRQSGFGLNGMSGQYYCKEPGKDCRCRQRRFISGRDIPVQLLRDTAASSKRQLAPVRTFAVNDR